MRASLCCLLPRRLIAAAACGGVDLLRACVLHQPDPRPTPPLPPALCSYWDQGAEKRAQVGIRDNLIRFSCGIESAEDIWADFEQAFARL